ncbi:hypothetical protein ACFYO1_42190 [Nocardia sp. NPDC006044]|uniref:hypothetical protein n=1 Tax=Nocardia sp. NPDC006044 TaxID=3364306 RepID=UPI0036ABA1C8
MAASIRKTNSTQGQRDWCRHADDRDGGTDRDCRSAFELAFAPVVESRIEHTLGDLHRSCTEHGGNVDICCAAITFTYHAGSG